MIMYIYTAIAAWFLALVVWNLYREDKALAQLTCAMVLVPLLLRVLGIK